jgi:hypothetical protein
MVKFNNLLWNTKEVSKEGKLFLNIKPTKLMLVWLFVSIATEIAIRKLKSWC